MPYIFFNVRTTLILALFFFVTFNVVSAQFLSTTYRPRNTQYKVLKTKHFDVLFDAQSKEAAQEAAAILESTLADTRTVIGNKEKFHLTVILNSYNDLSNGFVTMFPFRSEIEIPAIRGKKLNMTNDSWLEVVLPHELTHAVDIESYSRKWLTPLKIFSEFGHIIEAIKPSGLLEGIATYRESLMHDSTSGRLHYPYFNMQFQAPISAGKAWSYSQAVTPPVYGRTRGRHYVGGSHFMQFIHEKYGSDAFAKFNAQYNRLPFLGISLAFKHSLGKSARKLSKEFKATSIAEEKARIEALGTLTKPQFISNKRGLEHNRPIWLDNHTIISQITAYNRLAGFYQTDISSRKSTFLAPYGSTEDDAFSLDKAQNRLLFAAYKTSKYNDNQDFADAFSLDLQTHHVTQLTHEKRVFTPVSVPNTPNTQGQNAEATIWATQNRSQFSDLVKINADGTTETAFSLPRGRILEVAPKNGTNQAAILINESGHQTISLVDLSADLNSPKSVKPDLGFDKATIFDLSWHPDGAHLLFTADLNGVANVYAYNTKTDALYQVTNVPFGAFEASASPDGKQIAFIYYDEERQNLALLPFDPAQFKHVDAKLIHFADQIRWQQQAASTLYPPIKEAEEKPYNALSTLAPRVILPNIWRSDDLGNGYGLRLYGADITTRFGYEGSIMMQASRLWGEASIQTGRFPSKPKVSIFDRPYTSDTNQYTEERGIELSASLPVYLESVSTLPSRANLGMIAQIRQLRNFSSTHQALSDFRPYLSLTTGVQLVHHVSSIQRQLIPAHGIALSLQAQLDHDIQDNKQGFGAWAKVTKYIAIGTRHHHGLSLSAALLAQNDDANLSLNDFTVRGYNDLGISTQRLLKGSINYAKPLWFIDNGFNNVPVFFDALYLFGFGDAVTSLDKAQHQATIGAGLGLQMRVLNNFAFNFRLGGAFQVNERKFVPYIKAE
jgi:hypothetical protein